MLERSNTGTTTHDNEDLLYMVMSKVTSMITQILADLQENLFEHATLLSTPVFLCLSKSGINSPSQGLIAQMVFTLFGD